MLDAIQDQLCPLWHVPAKVSARAGYDILEVVSDRVGGSYAISRQAQVNADQYLSSGLNAKITSWIISERMAGVMSPTIDTAVVDRCRVKDFLPISERKRRFFQFLKSKKYELGDRILLRSIEGGLAETPRISAWIEGRYPNGNDISPFLDVLIEDGLIEVDIMRSQFWLKSKGLEKLEAIEAKRSSRNAFVAMWFDDSLIEFYHAGIATALIKCGYQEPFRVDRHEHANKIDDEIIAMITRSSLVIADLTCGVHSLPDGKRVTSHRGGVYYEAGYAQGLGIPVIWTCQKGVVSDIHFDLRQYNQIVWHERDSDLFVETMGDEISFEKALTNRIVAMRLSHETL